MGEPLRPEVVVDVVQADLGLLFAYLVLLSVEESQRILREWEEKGAANVDFDAP